MERFIEPIAVGILSGILTTVICYLAGRYWSNRSIKSLERKIQEQEAYKAHLALSAQSEKATVLRALQMLIALVSFLYVTLITQTVLIITSRTDPLSLHDVTYIFVVLLPAALGFGTARWLHDVEKYPSSSERLDKRITNLKEKLTGRKKK